MRWLLHITSLLISIFVALTSSKHIEVPSYNLILDYNWPEPKKNLQRYPHPVSCSYFYVNNPDGSQSIKECPENQLFDFRSLRCRVKAAAKCWTDLIKKGHLKKIQRHFNCPFPWGLFPNVEDCSTFYDCLSGRPYLQKCPYLTLFDTTEKTCVDENEAICADRSDIVEADYKCPKKWGYFTYAKDCSKYYECLQKVPTIRSCKKNMLFDNLKGECMPVSIVDCGERFNPYEKKIVTTKRIPTGGIQETSKLPPTGEEGVKTERFSTSRDGMTTKRIPTGGIQDTTKLPSTEEERVKTERISSGGDGMTTKHIPTGGIQDTSKLPPTGEESVKTERISSGGDGMTTKRILTGGIQDTSKLPPTGEERIKTERISTGGRVITTKLPPTVEELVTTERASTGGEE